MINWSDTESPLDPMVYSRDVAIRLVRHAMCWLVCSSVMEKRPCSAGEIAALHLIKAAGDDVLKMSIGEFAAIRWNGKPV